MKIGQLAFFRLSTPADQPYGTQALGSKYRGQRGPTASRYFENFADPGSAKRAADLRPEDSADPGSAKHAADERPRKARDE
jgi:hypothetical protein